jgi:hypothetical protein
MPPIPADPTLKPGKRPRDIRLDVARGLCLVIIFIAHIFDNSWAAWIPARFGFSDATEIFVFCSGMASALAFGGTFRSHGMLTGTARIVFRCWQVYWAHLAVFLVAAAIMIAADAFHGPGIDYAGGLGLGPLFDQRAGQALLGIVTLRWVPNYFDILPMYLGILLMVPIVVALSRFGLRYVALFVAVTWLAAFGGWLSLPAEPWGMRPWFFNPFSWQLLFFTGFAFMSGWLPAPLTDRRLVYAAIAFVVASLPLAWAPLHESLQLFTVVRDAIAPLIDKTTFGVFRYLHFLSLAYLAFAAAGEGGRNLTGVVIEQLRRLGQQSLSIFTSGLILAFTVSVVLTEIGRTFWTVALINGGGIAILVVIARAVTYFKSAPWSRPPVQEPVAIESSGSAAHRPSPSLQIPAAAE